MPANRGRRGKMHHWQFQSIFGETVLRCTVCGLLGEAETTRGPNSIGYRGRPIYGCDSPNP